MKSSWNTDDSVSDVKSEVQDALVDAKSRLLFQNRRSVRDMLVRDVPRSMAFRQQHLAALTTF